MDTAKVLVLDIETLPMLVSVWELGEQYIGTDQIERDWALGAWGAKWLNKSGIMYEDQRNKSDKYNDKQILSHLWKLLDEADIVITQNGENFDGPKLNARFIMNGMKPPSPYKHLDTYKIARSVAKFTSNKLEYLTSNLNKKHKKTSHKMFPGRSLWKECVLGNKKAWEEMKKYNIEDVLSTEELYNTIKAWTPERMPDVYFTTVINLKCRVCGKQALIKRGHARTKKAVYQNHQCKECGAWTRGEKIK